MYEDDYNEFEDNFNEETEQDEITQIMQANEVKGTYYDVVDQLVRANFKSIEKQGIDIQRMKLTSLNANQLKDTLDFMLNWFVETEEYEKCKTIQSYLEELKEA
jgi:hypothetical protein